MEKYPTTTLDKLGLSNPGIHIIGMDRTEIAVTARPTHDQQGTAYFALPRQPLAGALLEQFLTGVENPNFDGYFIGDDLKGDHTPMLTMFKKWKQKGLLKPLTPDKYNLMQHHFFDPEIGSTFAYLLAEKGNAYHRALTYTQANGLPWAVHKNSVFDDLETIGKSQIEGWLRNAGDGEKEPEYNNPVGYLTLTAAHHQQGKAFAEYLKQHPEYRTPRWQDPKKTDKDILNRIVYVYNRPKLAAKRPEIVKDFYQTVDPDEYYKYYITHLHDTFGRGVVDLKTGNVYPNRYTNVRTELLQKDPPIIAAYAKDGSRVLTQMRPKTDHGRRTAGNYLPEELHYQFSSEYQKAALTPLLAWETRDGERRIISDPEVATYKPGFESPKPTRTDTLLGGAFAAFTAPEITDDWDRTMKIASMDREQDIAGAQAIVWANLPKHLIQIAAQAPLLPKLEQVIR